MLFFFVLGFHVYCQCKYTGAPHWVCWWFQKSGRSFKSASVFTQIHDFQSHSFGCKKNPKFNSKSPWKMRKLEDDPFPFGFRLILRGELLNFKELVRTQWLLSPFPEPGELYYVFELAIRLAGYCLISKHRGQIFQSEFQQPSLVTCLNQPIWKISVKIGIFPFLGWK